MKINRNDIFLEKWQWYIIDNVFEFSNICNDYSQIFQSDIYKELIDINSYYELELSYEQIEKLTIYLFYAINNE